MPRIRAPFLIVLLILAATSPATSQQPGRAEDEKALRHLKEVEWPKAYREQDTALLDRILADEFQMVDADGNWSAKDEEMDWIRKNKPSYDSFRFVIRRLEIFENGTAVVAGMGIIQGKDDQGPYVMEYQSSNIFIKRGGQWKAIASHVSGAKRKNAS